MFVYGTFEDEQSAAEAVRALMRSGFDVRYVSALMRTGSQVDEVPVSVESGVRRGAVLGAALGAAGGALLGTGSGFLVAGPLVGVIEAALGAGAAGVIPGGVLGLLFADAKVEFGDGDLDADTIFLGVNADTRPALARDIFAKCQARQVEVTDHDASPSSLSG